MTPGTLNKYDPSNGMEILRLGGLADVGFDLTFSPNGTLIACSDIKNKKVHVWNVVDRKQVLELSAGEGVLIPVAFSPDSHYLAWGSGHGTVSLCEMPSGRNVRELKGQLPSVASSLCFSVDSRFLAQMSH